VALLGCVVTMYDNVAPHAWSPPNFPRTDEEAKVRYAPRHGTLNDDALWLTSDISVAS
jgi:hypothetical protein